ncbi:hypothetical protein [Leifsonia sp. NPDC058248]|uniref:hypothetical protein n=1 Tax=Leifsonia sp. NPDC058248 TaxID=3346402 RepID=UPI0036DCC9BF
MGNTGVAEGSAGARRWKPIGIAVGAVGAHVLVAGILIVVVLISADRVAGHGVSADALYTLGPGPVNAAYGACIPILFGATGAWVLILSPRRRFAWVAPVVGIVLSVVLCVASITTFQVPRSTPGGVGEGGGVSEDGGILRRI